MKILFIHNYLATFTSIDLDILRSAHEVRELYVSSAAPARFLRANASLAHNVQWSDLVFSWFGGLHALLPFTLGRMFGRKCVVVASGYDVGDMPEIDYGNMRPGVRRQIGRRVFALADRVLAVSEFTRNEAIRNAGVPASKIEVIAHGLDPQKFRLPVNGKRARQVLTVGGATEGTVRTKGLGDFIRVAAQMPEVIFLVVGPQDESVVRDLSGTASPNIQFLGPLYGDALIQIMQQSTVYTQLSAYESFGMAVVEAMLCGCIPVVSNRGALPEVVDDTGFVVPYGDIAAAAQAIRTALATQPRAAMSVHDRAASMFSLKRRSEALLRVVEEVAARSTALDGTLDS